MRKLKGKTAKAVSFILVLASLSHLYTNIFGVFPAFLMRSMHLSYMLSVCFLIFPASKKSPNDHPSLLDICLSILSVVVALYIMFNYEVLQSRWMYVSPVSDIEVIFGTICVLLILEASRRAVTPMITIVASLSIAYLFFCPFFSGILHYTGFSFKRIIEMLYLDSSHGIHGILVGISATYVIIFILFGSFMNSMGMGEFFINFAKAVTGKQVGGPAKIAVVASALFGTISGSAAANVYTTGAFTIPLMKKIGYRTQFAAAVEAVASTGGQAMPPVMGAAAFIMAELIGVPYIKICLFALIPATLYFISVFLMIHFESLKHNLKGNIGENIDKAYIIKNLYNFIPLLGLIYILVIGMSAMRAAFIGIILTILISYFKKETWMTPRKIFNALENGARNAVMIAIALSCAGIVVSVIINTGLGLSFGSIIMGLSGGKIVLILIFVMILTLILGCGLPTSASYIVSAAISTPILIKAGFDVLPSHLFVFYFAFMGSITPPIAIAAYAAAALAKAQPMLVGYEAVRLGMLGFIVPFAFITNYYLLTDGPISQILVALILSIIGIIALSAGAMGYVKNKISILKRIFLIMFGIAIIFYRVIISIIF